MNSETVIADVTVAVPLGDSWTFTAVDVGYPSAVDGDRYYVQTWRRDPESPDDALIYVESMSRREAVADYIGRRARAVLELALSESGRV